MILLLAGAGVSGLEEKVGRAPLPLSAAHAISIDSVASSGNRISLASAFSYTCLFVRVWPVG